MECYPLKITLHLNVKEALMAKLTQSQKNEIARNKEILAKKILETNKLTTLSDREKEFLNEILTRHLKDQRGNYELRIKELYQDMYIVCGIIYRNTHLLDNSFPRIENNQ